MLSIRHDLAETAHHLRIVARAQAKSLGPRQDQDDAGRAEHQRLQHLQGFLDLLCGAGKEQILGLVEPQGNDPVPDEPSADDLEDLPGGRRLSDLVKAGRLQDLGAEALERRRARDLHMHVAAGARLEVVEGSRPVQEAAHRGRLAAAGWFDKHDAAGFEPCGEADRLGKQVPVGVLRKDAPQGTRERTVAVLGRDVEVPQLGHQRGNGRFSLGHGRSPFFADS